jgi:CBS domain-containing membrane protein
MAITTVRDIMTSPVVTLGIGDTLLFADRLMKLGRIRHLPVVDSEMNLVGLLTHRMILSAWLDRGAPGVPGSADRNEVAQSVPVEMLMEKSVRTISPDAPAHQAAEIIERHKFGCLPVVADGKLVGILTEADFLKFARRYLEEERKQAT